MIYSNPAVPRFFNDINGFRLTYLVTAKTAYALMVVNDNPAFFSAGNAISIAASSSH